MKKFSLFSVIVALAFLFGACNKDVPDQMVNEDPGVSGAKKWVFWCDGGITVSEKYSETCAAEYYTFGKITASDFAHFESGGTQFNNNNSAKFPIPGLPGAYLRGTGNGNSTVWVNFDGVDLDDTDLFDGSACTYSFGVRFKGSVNAVFEFNLEAMAGAGEVKLEDAGMGTISQIRFGSEPIIECKPKIDGVKVILYKEVDGGLVAYYNETISGGMILDVLLRGGADPNDGDPFYFVTDSWDGIVSVDGCDQPERGTKFYNDLFVADGTKYYQEWEALYDFFGVDECQQCYTEHYWKEVTTGREVSVAQLLSYFVENDYVKDNVLELVPVFGEKCEDVIPQKYTVTFYPLNSDDFPIQTESDLLLACDAAITYPPYPENSFVPEGLIFRFWSIDPDDDDTSPKYPNDTECISANLNFYPVFSPIEKILFIFPGIDGEETYFYETDVTFNFPYVPEKEGDDCYENFWWVKSDIIIPSGEQGRVVDFNEIKQYRDEGSNQITWARTRSDEKEIDIVTLYFYDQDGDLMEDMNGDDMIIFKDICSGGKYPVVHNPGKTFNDVNRDCLGWIIRDSKEGEILDELDNFDKDHTFEYGEYHCYLINICL